MVPKFLVNEDGSLGARNGVQCGKIEEKMGIHGNSTCVMNYDDGDGWMVGEPHKGLRAMFTMMNEARLMVGMQGLSPGRDRLPECRCLRQGPPAGPRRDRRQEPGRPADPLIVHPDVRRMLLDQKAFIEGGRAFMLWGATMIDAEKRHKDEAARGDAGAMIALLTPVIKAFLTDKGLEATVNAQQVFGGHGYVEEWGQSQFVRDVRIAMIYEGANGVQALDLVGRKLPMKGGKPIMTFFDFIKKYIKDNEEDLTLAREFLEPLKSASKDLQQAAMFFMQAGMKNPNAALSGSNDFLHMLGHVCLGFAWTRMAKAAARELMNGSEDKTYYENKIATGRYYMKRLLPATKLHLARIESGADPVMDLPCGGVLSLRPGKPVSGVNALPSPCVHKAKAANMADVFSVCSSTCRRES